MERIHEAHGDGTAGIVLNAGAWTHYSYAIMDAGDLEHSGRGVRMMSNVHAREARHCASVKPEVPSPGLAAAAICSACAAVDLAA